MAGSGQWSREPDGPPEAQESRWEGRGPEEALRDARPKSGADRHVAPRSVLSAGGPACRGVASRVRDRRRQIGVSAS